MRILGVSGSLRTNSTNTAMLRTLAILGTGRAELIVRAPGDLPLYNPDLDYAGDSPVLNSVQKWRNSIRTADAVLFACPEYGHGVPGALKNALDWIVSSGELSGKPVAITNAYANRMRGTHARAALGRTLRAMDARLVEQTEPDSEGEVYAYSVRACVESLLAAV